MPTPARLGELEQLVLLAVLRQNGEAHAISVRQELRDIAGRSVTRGALYRTLERLCEKGLLRWRLEDGGPARGGHPRRTFEVRAAGVAALRASRRVLTDLWSGLEEVLQ